MIEYQLWSLNKAPLALHVSEKYLRRSTTQLHTKNLAVNLQLNRGFTLLHTKHLAVNLRLNRGLTRIIT